MSTYLSSMQLQKGSPVSRNSNLAARSKARKGLGPIANALFMAVILTLMGLLYLSQVTKTNNLSFEISELETRKTQLVQENQTLTNEAARLSAIERVQTSDVAASLDDPTVLEYLQ